MSPSIFQNKLLLMLSYIDKLNKENIPLNTQRILIKTYANDLKINLTSNMVFEMLSYKYINDSIYRLH